MQEQIGNKLVAVSEIINTPDLKKSQQNEILSILGKYVKPGVITHHHRLNVMMNLTQQAEKFTSCASLRNQTVSLILEHEKLGQPFSNLNERIQSDSFILLVTRAALRDAIQRHITPEIPSKERPKAICQPKEILDLISKHYPHLRSETKDAIDHALSIWSCGSSTKWWADRVEKSIPERWDNDEKNALRNHFMNIGYDHLNVQEFAEKYSTNFKEIKMTMDDFTQLPKDVLPPEYVRHPEVE